ncbi:hypothetical protein AB0333_09490 [Citricoccus sp. NPDC079358]|jgi:hypothetical protein|uniref:hypothetical protein n=1 Tax=Citricoccus sp. NPDC079358 TaxID=3154653 RepID=UPI0034505A0B
MPGITIGVGVLLIIVGVIAYFMSGATSWTALIPTILGVLILCGGLIGLKSPKIGVHAGLVLALLGILGTSMNVLQLGALFAGEAERPAAVIASTVTFVLLVVYVVLGVRSFIRARRWKRGATAVR